MRSLMPKPERPIKFIVEVKSQDGILMRADAWIFHSLAEWKSIGAELAANEDLYAPPWPDPPAFDWKRRSLIVVSAGEKTTGPCSIKVARIVPEGKNAVVHADIQGPGSLAVMTHPWQMVSIHGKQVESVRLA